jgi:hypothetical protein
VTTWLATHRSVMKLASAGLAVVVVLTGVIAGARQPAAGRQSGSSDTQQLVAHVQGSRHSVIGVVRGIGPNGFLVRNPAGVVFAVRWGPDSRFRAAGREIRPGALRVGDRVLVLGRPAPDGTLHASVTTITARPGGAPPAATSPNNGGQTGSTTGPQ